MEIMDIIKEAFIFPSNDLGKLAIYLVLVIVLILLTIVGLLLSGLGAAGNVAVMVIGIILIIASIIVGFIVNGYQVSIIKSGIDMDENAPEFVWKENLITGIKYFIVNIVYFIIPAIIVLITGLATNLFGNAKAVFFQFMDAYINASATNTTVIVNNVVPQSTLVSLGTAMIITGVVAFVVFIFFSFLQTMGVSRLANTGSLGDSLNIVESFKDIGRIGWGKVIATVILIFVIIAVINVILSSLNNAVPGISILSIVVTPYLIFFASRATGLLYSDIA